MARKGFDLAALAREAMGGDAGVSNLDTAAPHLRLIPFEKIIPDPENGYSLDGIEELAGNIETVGLLDPLVVLPETDVGYPLLSGHRRREAIGLIIDGGNDMFKDGVPCIVRAPSASADNPRVSELLGQLTLLLANADNRKKTSADLNHEAERLELVVGELADLGFKFPGRRRDWVSELSGLSRTKLARLKVIREKLDGPLQKEYYNKGKMNESVAYELAQRPVELQRRICDAYMAPGRNLCNMYASFVSNYAKAVDEVGSMKCKLNNGGCTNQERILEKRFDTSYNYKPCAYGHCCADCDQYLRCRNRCHLLDDKAKEERRRQVEDNKDIKAAEKSQRESDIRKIEQVWGRFGQALLLAGLDDQRLRKQLNKGQGGYNEFDTYIREEKLESLLDYSATDTKVTDPLPFFYDFKVRDYDRLVRIADALGCSLDFLFLRDDIPDRRNNPVSNSDTPPGLVWHRCDSDHLPPDSGTIILWGPGGLHLTPQHLIKETLRVMPESVTYWAVVSPPKEVLDGH